jgi:hypothetical protein
MVTCTPHTLASQALARPELPGLAVIGETHVFRLAAAWHRDRASECPFRMAAGDQETVLGQLRSWSAARRIIQKQTIAW